MNNTTTERNLAVAAVLFAAMLVVGATFSATTQSTQSAFAYQQKKGPQDNNKKGARDNGNGNGNTVTIQKCKHAATQSGWDNNQEQECQNLICTHPGENATCSQEGVTSIISAPTPEPTTGTLLVKKVEVCVLSVCPVLSDFTITVTGNNPTPSTFPASVSGTLVTLGTGAFSVKETSPFGGFTTTFSADCSGTIVAGDHKTCTITNTQEGDT